MAVRTTVVGSWWWPEEHSEELARFHSDELGETRESRSSTAARRLRSGSSASSAWTRWTDGEYFTYNFVNHLQKRLTGIEVDRGDQRALRLRRCSARAHRGRDRRPEQARLRRGVPPREQASRRCHEGDGRHAPRGHGARGGSARPRGSSARSSRSSTRSCAISRKLDALTSSSTHP